MGNQQRGAKLAASYNDWYCDIQADRSGSNLDAFLLGFVADAYLDTIHVPKWDI